MRTKTKSFDCVEMKDRIQAERRVEYEARKDEFPSFLAFVRARAKASDWVEQMSRQFAWTE